MKPQVIQDHNGKPTGVFIPIEDWNNIKKKYPDFDQIGDELPQWQKDIIDLRLNDLDNPEKIKSIENLFEVLDKE
ncbi:addiction module component CHP02574 family protein [Parapusillimonas sp. SGNA-6]|uniref:addiction module component CHP02574 family protein n=1 Tax=Parapedobacter sp. SGR-10 TaxID=2710879 RepID=UPI0013D06287|nr:addiction module component CHP02574 family protein [Parapedobacter sp. SGR-10]NGF54903.1 addiction module component CHP02574 family protein [Parapedobacter sp. SGR-10]NGM89730.1 addiction module component CHP02574 family protein [Parapusillimonas sp. SGNA-6]